MWKKNSDIQKRILILITIGALLYGTGMELVQKYFIANRSFDTGDIAADAGGCGIALLYVLKRLKKNRPL